MVDHKNLLVMPLHRGGALCIASHRLSVRLTVLCLTHGRGGRGAASWKLARRKPVTGLTRDPIYRSKGQRSRSLGGLMLWLKMNHVFGTERSANFKLGTRMDRWSTMITSPSCVCWLQTEHSGWLYCHHLHAARPQIRPHSLFGGVIALIALTDILPVDVRAHC